MVSTLESTAAPVAQTPRPSRVGDAWRAITPHRNWVVVAITATGLAVWSGQRFWLGPQVSVSAVVQRDFVQSVAASGRVETPHRVSIGAQVVGTATHVPVAEGQVVTAGQILVELDAKEARAAAAQSDIAVPQAQARLRRLVELQVPVAEQAARQAQVTLDNAHAQLRRSTDLFNQGFIGQAALSDAQKAVDLNESQGHSAQAQLAAVHPGGSDHAVATSALAQARASADEAHSRLRYLTQLRLRVPVPLPSARLHCAGERDDAVARRSRLRERSNGSARRTIA